MAPTTRSKTLVVALTALLAACSHKPAYEGDGAHRKSGVRQLTPDQQLLTQAEVERRAAAELRRARQGQVNRAYDQGVRDTLEEFQGRMHARQGFVYQPPIMDWVEMPSQVVNGALIPAHKQMVIVTSGRWVESNYANIPDDLVAPATERHAAAVTPAVPPPAGPAPVRATRFEYTDDQ